jgi:4-amino-4-deoxy-L-arabinose transferase-like glycosyltransferase
MTMHSFSSENKPSTKDTLFLDAALRQEGWLHTIGIGVALFLIALAPRVADLDVFLTADENIWLNKSTQFVLGLIQADWARTFQIGYPAVTTTWLGGLGLLVRYLWEGQSTASTLVEFLQGTHLEPSLLPFLRLPTVLLTTLSIPVTYFLVRRLWNSRVALLGTLFLAFDPFLLAHSRVLATDALLTVFMTLALLGLILALRSPRPWKTLTMAGLATGFAVLSKSPALVLFPFAGLFALLIVLTDKKRGSRKQVAWQLLQRLAIWGGIAVLTFFLFWPAMWVSPLQTLQGVWNKGMGHAKGGHLMGNFFWGREVNEADPGALYYPVSLLFRSTPVSLMGLAIIVISGAEVAVKRLVHRSVEPFRDERVQNGLALCTYIMLFGMFMNLGAKKFDRYILPIYPAIDILAAVGWCSVLKWGIRRMREAVGKRWISKGGVAVLLILQIGGSLPHYPYYLTAYNPMVGGGYLAPQVLVVGWGEGLEQVAHYLDRQTEEHPIRVASWYNHCLAPFFQGHSQEFPPLEHDLFRQDIDYAVFYINQMQRKRRNAKSFKYFRGWEPEYTVRLKGIEYAWVYPVPKPIILQNPQMKHPAKVNFGDKLMFLGYNVKEMIQKEKEPSMLEQYLRGHAELLPEHQTFFHITYFWQCLEEMEKDYTLVTQFEGHHDRIYRINQSHQGVNGAYPTSMWQVGEVIKEEYQVEVPADYPPIRYALWVGVWNEEERLEVVNDVEADEEDRVKLGEIEVLPAEEPTPLADKPCPQNGVEVNINDELLFLGYDLSDRNPQPSDQLQITTYWQSLRKTERDYAIQAELRNGGYKVREVMDIAPTRLWEEGRYYWGKTMLAINPHLLEGTYSLNLELERDDGTGTEVDLASLNIACQRRHILKRTGKAHYRGGEILNPDEPFSLHFHLKEREPLELVAGWTGKASGEETRVEVYITNTYWHDRYLGTWVVESGKYSMTKRRISKSFTAPGENVIELRVPEVRERVHNVGWRGVVDRVFPDLLQDPRTDYDGPIQIDFAQASSRWDGDWASYYDLAKVYAERGMDGEIARLYEEAVDQGVEPAQIDDFALFKGAYTALGEEGKVREIEERIAGRIAHKMNVNLGGKVEFLGYSLTEEEENDHGISLFFRCLDEMEEDYTLWVHVEVQDEALLEEQTGLALFDHLLPTSRWQVEEVVQDDEVRGLKPGGYHLTLGLWRPEDGSRLWWEDDPDTHVIDLGWVQIE